MDKLFEVPYNFNESLISFYKRYANRISFLYLPPYKDDSLNTRSSIETKKKGHSYMPQSRDEYEKHLREIVKSGLSFVVLWQVPDSILTNDMLIYYTKLGASGFIIGNDKNAQIIKGFCPNLLVIGSLVQRICKNIKKRDFHYYDYILLYYPFNRALDVLKELNYIKKKLVIMPNTMCHVECPSMHHWFPSREHPFDKHKDCIVWRNKDKYIENCAFISPEHLHFFDHYVGGYKLEGREYSTNTLKYICEIYFNRKSPKELLNAMMGIELSEKYHAEINKMNLEEYYNVKTHRIINII